MLTMGIKCQNRASGSYMVLSLTTVVDLKPNSLQNFSVLFDLGMLLLLVVVVELLSGIGIGMSNIAFRLTSPF